MLKDTDLHTNTNTRLEKHLTYFQTFHSNQGTTEKHNLIKIFVTLKVSYSYVCHFY